MSRPAGPMAKADRPARSERLRDLTARQHRYPLWLSGIRSEQRIVVPR